MVNTRLRETTRPAFFSDRPRLYIGFATNSRLRDVQNRAKKEIVRPVKFDQNFARPIFFRYHSPPL